MNRLHTTLTAALAVLVLATGCVSPNRVAKKIEAKQGKVRTAPTRNITGFTPALRCMDQLLIDHRVPEVRVLMEDLKDSTGKVKAGTRDMVIAAVSDMTRRSRAVRVNAFGNDSGNLVSYIAAAERKAVYKNIPSYDIRGSISGFDKGLVREQADVGFEMDDFGFGGSKSASGSVMSLDLSVISTHDLSVVPGVYSRNSLTLLDSAVAVDADASIVKAGVNFSLAFTDQDGMTQGLRHLVELATIELFGRLLKLPYWQCLDLDPRHEEVAEEVADWFYGMQTHGELLAFLQHRLHSRGFFAGRVDGRPGPEIDAAVAEYRAAANLAGEGADFALFEALLSSTEPSREPSTRRALSAVEILSTPADPAPGDPLGLTIRANRSGYLYCYYQDESGSLLRFFPNRFQGDAYVTPEMSLEVPGAMPFQIVAATRGVSERVGCFLTRRDVLDELPDRIRAADFEALERVSMADLREGIHSVAGGEVAEAEIDLAAR